MFGELQSRLDAVCGLDEVSLGSCKCQLGGWPTAAGILVGALAGTCCGRGGGGFADAQSNSFAGTTGDGRRVGIDWGGRGVSMVKL